MANQNVRRRLSDAEMNRGIGMLEAGSNQREVACILGVSQSVIGRLWQRYQTHGNVMHRHGGAEAGQGSVPIHVHMYVFHALVAVKTHRI